MATGADLESVAGEYRAAREEPRDKVFDAFRRWGYLQADLDPLGFLRPQPHPDLQLTGPDAASARSIYSGTIGAECMHLADPEKRQWIAQRMEAPAAATDQQHILSRLVRAEIFEQVLQSRYLGTKRFSLEGITALIPLLDELLEGAAEHNAEQAVIGMSHRGRLNVIINIVGRPGTEVFAGFEDVDPVALGRVRAKQARFGEGGRERFLPILLHGDAAFAGQGIWAETMNFADLQGFSVGGAVHVIVNNLIGFTTVPSELHSSRFAASLARRQEIPIFHVNGEDPDAVVRVARMALEYRYRFFSDVVVDVIGFRRHGHSEVDDPTITQPRLYQAIQEHPPLWQIYADDTG